jgi:uncharacterized protein DUF1549/uncharacterized protein DUF1553
MHALRHRIVALCLLSLVGAATPTTAAPLKASVPSAQSLHVEPSAVKLLGPQAEQALLVTFIDPPGQERDATRRARYMSNNLAVARVTPEGLVRIVGNGSTEIRVAVGGREAQVPVVAREATQHRRLNFTNDILPVLSQAGCNQGTCHGKASGQHGFRLSIFAFDPQADYNAIVKDARGRRVCGSDPDRSLFLRKPAAQMPHGGGRRFAVGSPEYRLLHRWIAEGMPFRGDRDPALERVVISPAERVLGMKQEQQLLATAVFSDGSRRDVTRAAAFSSNEDEIAAVDPSGLIRTADVAGEAAVMVRYMGQIAVSRITVPRSGGQAFGRSGVQDLPDEGRAGVTSSSASATRTPDRPNAGIPERLNARTPERLSFIDELVLRKLARLRITPSPRCTDAEFVRRAFLDVIGTLPTPAETRAFLGDTDPRRRATLVDTLLERPEYADYWGMRWSDILLVNRDPLFPKGAYAFDRWVRDSFRRNRPYNELAFELLTAQGATYRDGAANFFRAAPSPRDAAIAVSQLFLGVRLECAQCHHHPSERWSQDDFYRLAAYFARMQERGASEYEAVISLGKSGEVKNPRTGQVMAPRPLLGPAPAAAEDDSRISLAAWVTAPENPFFAREAVNRVWAALLGRGLFEPIDDQRVTNPASNEPLLDALAQAFVRSGYDFKQLIRTILASETYQRSARSNPTNVNDTRNYSRAYPRRLPAEVLMDAVDQVTGVPELFNGLPPGLRATQLWDNKLDNYFLNVFGRPGRISVCSCERSSEGSLTQVLHLMNSPGVQGKLAADEGRVAQLAASPRSAEQIVGELYLATYSREPTSRERRAALAAFSRSGATRRSATEDLLWALINSPEFVFNR